VTVAERQQTCPRCSVELDVTAQPVGAWLACPGCAQPIQVVARRVERPAKSAEPEPPSSAWLADPRLDAPTQAAPAAPRITERTPPLPAWSPVAGAPAGAYDAAEFPEPAGAATEPATTPARGRRRYGGIVFVLATMCAVAQVIFVSSVLQAVGRPEDVALSALFGAGLGTFVALMASAIRREDDARARGGR
jgi:hypothetical protein